METIEMKHVISPNLQANKAYQSLIRKIQLYGNEMKIIGITSCNQIDEKSSVTLNLAISMAEAGKKVILVDMDMFQAVLSKKVIADRPERGLFNYLEAMNTTKEIICHTDMEKLDMILSGTIPSNFSEARWKEKFNLLILELAGSYDYILVDLPPLDTLMEGTKAAEVYDGMLLVVKANTVSYEAGRKSKMKLDLLGCPILGAVMLGGA